ncbi:MAG: hypothetical protein Kow00114_31320 [Kiloniellaceae bacterium]
MEDRELGRIRFKTRENRDGVELCLREGDFERIFRKFRDDKQAYAGFLELCEDVKTNKNTDKTIGEYAFLDAINRISQSVLGECGGAASTLVWEELLKRHGVPPKWR